MILQQKLTLTALLLTVCIPAVHARSKFVDKVVPRFFLDNFHTIKKDTCYRSNQLSGRKLEKYVKEHNIKTVLNLRGKREGEKWWRAENDVCKKNGVELVNVSLEANRYPTPEELKTILKATDRPGALLVHCYAGKDRTGEIAGILEIENGAKVDDALKQAQFVPYGHFSIQYPNVRKLIKIWGKLRTTCSREQALKLYEVMHTSGVL